MIVAQSPMDNTADDFWKMIIQYRVSAIVMCCELVENEQVSFVLFETNIFHQDILKDTCSVYWPSSEEPVMYGRYQVHQDSETEEQGFIRRNLIVECHEDVSSIDVYKQSIHASKYCSYIPRAQSGRLHSFRSLTGLPVG